ncbi:hypothetical protein [Pseudomonas sp. EZ-C24]|uniref:hypothetical protein n=1 Tax=Pseudomonas sp. EZ-C24 TaxID=2753617 RepID=UPI00165E9FB4|nr:hypothetical protein [Pseudomonas sp. EZ-C24]
MTTPIVMTLIDEQIAELPEAQALPDGRVLMLFTGPTMFEAKRAAAEAFIENPEAWSCRACLCGEWTVGYEVRA